MKRLAALVVFIGAFVGCAIAPQQVTLSPTLALLSSVQGANISVAVRVVDDRRSTTLGRLVGGSGGSVEVTSSQDVAGVVEKCLIDGLKKKGFVPVDYQEGTSPSLTVDVRLLDYVAYKGFPTGRALIKGELKAAAVRGKATFESMYRSEREEKFLSMPDAEKTGKWINNVLGDVVSQLLSDAGLLKFLVE
jgi:uncharacterized lipoprotein YajG